MVDLVSVGMVAVDLFYRGSSLTQKNGRFELAVGGKYFSEGFHMNIGGGALNVASAAMHQGARVTLAAQYPENEFTPFILSQLEKLQIDYSLSFPMSGFDNISSILVNPSGERTIINYRTPHQHLLHRLHNRLDIVETRAMYVANLPDVDFQERVTFLKRYRSKKSTIFSNLGVVDCRRPTEEIDAFLSGVDVVIINTYECADMIKKSHDLIDFHTNIRKIYFPHHPHLTLIVTAEAKGSWGYTNDRVFFQKAEVVPHIVNTTGAGDAYTGGFIAEFLRDHIMQKAMEKASQEASFVISRIGTH